MSKGNSSEGEFWRQGDVSKVLGGRGRYNMHWVKNIRREVGSARMVVSIRGRWVEVRWMEGLWGKDGMCGRVRIRWGKGGRR